MLFYVWPLTQHTLVEIHPHYCIQQQCLFIDKQYSMTETHRNLFIHSPVTDISGLGICKPRGSSKMQYIIQQVSQSHTLCGKCMLFPQQSYHIHFEKHPELFFFQLHYVNIIQKSKKKRWLIYIHKFSKISSKFLLYFQQIILQFFKNDRFH